MTDPNKEPPWWSVGKPPADDSAGEQGPTAPPGFHITFTPPTPPAAPADTRTRERRARARRWFLIHGASAGTGYTFGLYHSMAAFLDTLGPAAPATGLCLAGISWLGAEIITDRYGRFLPARLRPAVLWTARIPYATALLATALHAPNALI